ALQAPGLQSCLPDLQLAEKFVASVQCASLDAGHLSPKVLTQLRNPPCEPVDIDDNLRFFLDIYFALDNASRAAYESVCAAVKRRFNMDEKDVYSYDRIRRRVADITGVVAVMHDMCVKSCAAFTGPFADMEECPYCGEPRYDPLTLERSEGRRKEPQLQFSTNPLGPQIQAQKRSKKGAENMHYRAREMAQTLTSLNSNGGTVSEYTDLYHGEQLLQAVANGVVHGNDTVVLFSCDGAQLFRHKSSDCWIAIWQILDLSPDLRAKKQYILPACIIPGAPKNLDSFLHPSMHHLQALHNETPLDNHGRGGFKVWDASEERVVIDDPYLVFVTADGPGLASIGGLVGHKGKRGCRGNCPMQGRRKPGGKKYYPAHLKPIDYSVSGCTHDDVNPNDLQLQSHEEYNAALAHLLQARTEDEYTKLRRELGISKPSILSGLSRISGIPTCFTPDIMHFSSLNQPDLMLSLWRGTIDRDPHDREPWDWICLSGNDWKAHGEDVAACAPYIPGIFDIAPRNVADYVTSGYKAKEFQTYFFGLSPALLHHRLPRRYFRNYCKLVLSTRILHQYTIKQELLPISQTLNVVFIHEYESYYYCRMTSRLHFCQQSIHGLCHVAREVPRIGSLALTAQWTMERAIGNLGEEIRQPSNFYANLAQRSLCRLQKNAVMSMIPELEPAVPWAPTTSLPLANTYALLQPRESHDVQIPENESQVIAQYMWDHFHDDHSWRRIRKWGRLQLGCGLRHITRSLYAERKKSLEDVRMARNVKLIFQNQVTFGEVLYYFSALVGVERQLQGYAVLNLYGAPDRDILEESFHTIWLCDKQDVNGLVVVNVEDIRAVVGMIPTSVLGLQHWPNRYFLLEDIADETTILYDDLKTLVDSL
ncbi:hypothetical protein PUNSTDRAFT_76415, partial [Punctularia strigosozonata HHB-11173 SS5]